MPTRMIFPTHGPGLTMLSGLTLSTIAWNWSIGLKQPKATALGGGFCLFDFLI